jgi:hypothetical protein
MDPRNEVRNYFIKPRKEALVVRDETLGFVVCYSNISSFIVDIYLLKGLPVPDSINKISKISLCLSKNQEISLHGQTFQIFSFAVEKRGEGADSLISAISEVFDTPLSQIQYSKVHHDFSVNFTFPTGG